MNMTKRVWETILIYMLYKLDCEQTTRRTCCDNWQLRTLSRDNHAVSEYIYGSVLEDSSDIEDLETSTGMKPVCVCKN